MSDLETRLRGLADELPEPDGPATEAAHRVMRTALAQAGTRGAWRRSWRRVGRRPHLLAAAAALVVAGGALAASGWSVRDLPPFGHRSDEAFALPSTDILPGGYTRTHPPKYADLPTRPALLFPAGVGYTQALTLYSAARAHGRVLPVGVTLTDPLPAAKVLMVRSDHRVEVDPAAPFGFDPRSGLVIAMTGRFDGRAIPIARCQMLIGAHDPSSPACDAPRAARSYLREGVNGRWIPAPNNELVQHAQVKGSTDLSVLTNSSLPTGGLAAYWLEQPGMPPASRFRVVQAQKTADVTLIVASAGQMVCFYVKGPGMGGGCGPRASLLNAGADVMTLQSRSQTPRVSGLVGDGVTQVRADDGTSAPVINNTFTLVPKAGTTRLTFTGPIGTFTVRTAGNPHPSHDNPDRTRERVLVQIRLRRGGTAAFHVAPNQGGGTCNWLYILGQIRSQGCMHPGQTPLEYDIVTGGFEIGSQGYPYIYVGQFAPQVGAVSLIFRDGTTKRLPLTHGYVLYELPDRYLARSRWPAAAITYDTHGVPLVQNPISGFAVNVRQQGIPR